MGAPTISPAARNPFWFPCSAIDRFGKLYYIDGLTRGLVWDAQWPTMMKIGIEKGAQPAIAADAAGGALTQDGQYFAAIRYLDKNLQPGDLSEFDDETGPAADPTWRLDWSVNASTNPRVAYVELWRSTAGVAATVYLIIRLGNNGTVSTIANAGGQASFTCPTRHNLAIGARFLLTGSSIAGYNTTHVVTVVNDSFSFDTDQAYTSNATGGTWTLTGYVDRDDDSDNSLIANNESMQILNSDGTFYARRFGIPPSYKSAMIIFQDRAIYGVDIEYNQGTVSGSAKATTVTGSGTAWPDDFVGRDILIEGQNDTFRITTVATATSLTIDKPLVGAVSAGTAYVIRSPREFLDTFIYSEADEPESCPIDTVLGFVNTVKVQKNTSDVADKETGLMPLGGNFYSLRERHIYRVNFTRQPDIDAAINLAGSRGALTNRCWAQLNGVAYLMDDIGCYAFTGVGGPKPIDAAIHDYWRDGLIDMAGKKWFFVVADRQLEIVRFYVRLVGDTAGAYPSRSYNYHPATETWWEETYPWDIGHACHALIGGTVRLLIGIENDQILKSHDTHQDLGLPIAWSWRSGWFSFLVDGEQNAREIEITFKPTASTGSFICQTYLDQGTDTSEPHADSPLNQNAAMTANSAGVTVNTYRFRDDRGIEPGFAKWKIGGRLDERGQSGRFVQVQMTGAQTADFITIYSVALTGVEGG